MDTETEEAIRSGYLLTAGMMPREELERLNGIERRPARDTARRAAAGIAEARDRREWITGVKRRLGLVEPGDVPHRTIVRPWRQVAGGWGWYCRALPCGASGVAYQTREVAFEDALEHAMSWPQPPARGEFPYADELTAWMLLAWHGYNPYLEPRGVPGPPGDIPGAFVMQDGVPVRLVLRNWVCSLDGWLIDGHAGSDLDPGSTACIHCDYEGPNP